MKLADAMRGACKKYRYKVPYGLCAPLTIASPQQRGGACPPPRLVGTGGEGADNFIPFLADF